MTLAKRYADLNARANALGGEVRVTYYIKHHATDAGFEDLSEKPGDLTADLDEVEAVLLGHEAEVVAA